MAALPRVVFMGTPSLARVVLAALAADGRWTIPLVVAQPDKPVGRGLRLQAPPVKLEALERGLPVVQPARARDPEFLATLAASAPDVVVVAAYGQILPPDLLAIPRRGCLNVHTSLLPRWRGAAPIVWALVEGDAETGITIMRMDAGLDTGDVVAVERTAIRDDDTGLTLHDRLATLGAELLVRTLPDWLEDRIQPVPQPAEGVRYARKLGKEDGRLDWGQPAIALGRRVRAMNPWPGAFTTVAEPAGPASLLKVWEATPSEGAGQPGEVLEATGDDLRIACGDGALRIHALQREGRRRLSVREFLAGGGLRAGMRVGG